MLAKITVKDNELLPIGKEVAIVVKNKDLIASFADYVEGQTVSSQPAPPQPSQATIAVSSQKSTASTQAAERVEQLRGKGERVVASPLAKTVANERGIDLGLLKGSGPNGRIIKQDVDSYVPKPVAVEETKKVEAPLPPPVSAKSST